MPLIDVVQGSPEHRQARCGKTTASRIGDLMATPRSAGSGLRVNYLTELAIEWLTKEPYQGYQSAAMLAGIEREPEAAETYQLAMRSLDLRKTGFWTHPTIEGTGASPDRLLGDDAIVQFKCPEPKAHFDCLTSKGQVPNGYYLQMQWELACTERKTAHFVSYHPAFPERLKLCVIKIKRDDAAISNIEREVIKFHLELAEKVKLLTDMPYYIESPE